MPFVVDHKLGDLIVYPGAGYVEVSLSAYRNIMRLKDCFPIQMNSLEIIGALSASEQQEMNTILEYEFIGGKQTLGISFFSRPEPKPEEINKLQYEWRSNFKSTATNNINNKDQPVFDINKLNEEFEGHLVPEVYDTLRATGYNFGPAFQTLQNVSIKQNGLFAEIYACPKLLINGLVFRF